MKRPLVFPILLFSSASLHWLLRKTFLSLLVIFWNSAFKWVYLSFSPLPLACLLFSAICKALPDNHFSFFHFCFLEMVLIAASYRMSWTSVHSSPCRALASKSHKFWALHYDWVLVFMTFRFTYAKPQQFIIYGSCFPTCHWFPSVFCSWICVKFLFFIFCSWFFQSWECLLALWPNLS